jgi:hypothetical protein
MSGENQGPLDQIYQELKKSRDEIGLKLHLGSMELRDRWQELEGEWDTWVHQVKKDLGAKSDDLEAELREAGGDTLKKVEIATRVTISKLKRGLEEVAAELKGK